ncbi:MAG: hypothetical protein ACRDOI_44605 [Trebonia sp.]
MEPLDRFMLWVAVAARALVAAAFLARLARLARRPPGPASATPAARDHGSPRPDQENPP